MLRDAIAQQQGRNWSVSSGYRAIRREIPNQVRNDASFAFGESIQKSSLALEQCPIGQLKMTELLVVRVCYSCLALKK
ncbi:hypothetical protein NC99_44350 [Sunxiuqinia dokdonensis]|uniref:Uncharacterized protein n=1 Tax=Sunxiuqinia dokdonensis TaxID=1409788 RepID=A0A0L8V331_9BACT|nr:hypothetical protein NC99_44350 [Sunxiuqinia dokdonensis]